MADANFEAFNELRTACISQDVRCIQELFATGRADSELATGVLERVISRPVAVRCLLQHGADASNISPKGIRSAEVLRLLTESGWDVKAWGYSLLQSAFPTSSTSSKQTD